MADTQLPAAIRRTPAAAPAAPAATVPSGSTVKVEAAAPADTGPTRRVIAVGSLHGGTPAAPKVVQSGQATDLPEEEAVKLVGLGLARWPDDAVVVASAYDEAIKDTTAKTGEGKADEADARAERD